MRKFQQEITTRIREQRALEGHPESPARDVPDARYALDGSPDADLCSSDDEDDGRLCSSGGDNVGGLFVLPWSSLHVPPYRHRLISISTLTLTSCPHSVKAADGDFLRFLVSAVLWAVRGIRFEESGVPAWLDLSLTWGVPRVFYSLEMWVLLMVNAFLMLYISLNKRVTNSFLPTTVVFLRMHRLYLYHAPGP